MTELKYPYDTTEIAKLHPDGWKRLPVTPMLIERLLPTQQDVSIERIKYLLDGGWPEADNVAHVIYHKGHYYLHDGHHRYTIAVVKDRGVLNCRVVNDKGEAVRPYG